MNKILLTGHNGFLGQYICQSAKQKDIHIIGVSRTVNPKLQVKELQLDLSKDNFIDQLKDHAFDGVIHLAANGNVADCEENAVESQKINVQASRLLAEMAMQREIPMVFTSSDQVFDGFKGGYSPSDKAQPLNQYGMQKLKAEEEIIQVYPAAVVCRMPLMIGSLGGYERALKEKLKLAKPQLLFTDEVRSVLEAKDAAKLILEALDWDGGVYHLPGPVDLNRYELGLILATKYGLDLNLIQAGKQTDINLSVQRPKNATMVK